MYPSEILHLKWDIYKHIEIQVINLFSLSSRQPLVLFRRPLLFRFSVLITLENQQLPYFSRPRKGFLTTSNYPERPILDAIRFTVPISGSFSKSAENNVFKNRTNSK